MEGLWAHGIGLEGNTPNADIENNTINNLTDHKTPSDAVAINIEDNVDAASLFIQTNSFTSVNVGIRNVTESHVVAQLNWWGSVEPGFDTLVIGDVDYDPWIGKGEPTPVISIPSNNSTVFSSVPTIFWYYPFPDTGGVSYDVLN